MNKHVFRLFFWAVLVIGITIRIAPLINDSFYFTIDQGDDLLYVRSLVHVPQLLLKGPGTGIAGFYTGPLWYYLLAPWYIATGGHPIAGLLFLMFLNSLACAFLMRTVAKHTTPLKGLLVGVGLQLFWPFYETSRYSFHPFMLVFLTIALIIAVIELWEGKANRFFIIATLIGLVFHVEMAAAPIFIAFYLMVTIYFFSKRTIGWFRMMNGFLITGIFLIPHFIYEVTHDFEQTSALIKGLFATRGVLSSPSLPFILSRFEARVTESVVPHNGLHAFLLVGSIVGFLFAKQYFTHHPALDRFTKRFTICSMMLLFLSWIWFSTTHIWQPWHTAYNPTLFFITAVLLIYNTPARIRYCFLILLFGSQFWLFQRNYRHYLYPFADPSIFANQLSVLDWVYEQAHGKGFAVYNYVPSVYDPQYQYLFWWYGGKRYGYLAWQYANDVVIVDSYVPNKHLFIDPRIPDEGLRFLILEPDPNKDNQKQWIARLQKGTTMVNEAMIGTTSVQQRIMQR